ESEDTMGQRSDRARTQCFGNFTEQRARQIGPLDRELIDVDGKIGDVLAQRTQMDAPIEIEIALAEFEKAAERLEYVEALLHPLTAERVEHDIDASAGTDCAHRIGEAEITRIQHVIRASKPQEGALDLRSGGGDDDGAAVLGVLDRARPTPPAPAWIRTSSP